MVCDSSLVDQASEQDIGGFIDAFDLTLAGGAEVGDVVVVVQIADLGGSSSANLPTDDAGNDTSVMPLGGATVVSPITGVDGFHTGIVVYPVVNAIAPGQQVHVSYSSGPPISFNYVYVFRGLPWTGDVPTIKYHGDFDVDFGHGVGACAEELFPVDGPGMIFETTTIMHPYVSYAGDPMTWTGDVTNIDSWDSDPDDNAILGFDSGKGQLGYSFVDAAGTYPVGGCWSVEQDTYRGGFSFFMACDTIPATNGGGGESLGARPGFLAVCGKEIANNSRTEDYLRSGLGSGEAFIEIGEGCDCSILYRLSGETVTFTSPSVDPAPWFDSNNSDSESFLGFLLDPSHIDGLDSVVSRAVYERAGGIQGAATGAQKLTGRRIPVRMMLVADDCCGLEYGFRWLTNTLAASNCDQCQTCIMQIRVCCPPEDGSDDTEGLYILYDVALIDGPHWVQTDGIEPGCCDMRAVEFTLLAGNPYLYSPAEACIDPTVIPGVDFGSMCVPFDEWFCLGSPSEPICCTVDPPDVGTLGGIVTVTAPSGADGIEVGTFASCPPEEADWDDETGTWKTKLTISSIEAGASMVIDSARHEIIYVTPDGDEVDGTSRLLLPPDRAFRWIEVADCDAASCICIRGTRICGYGSGDVTISIETQLRVA